MNFFRTGRDKSNVFSHWIHIGAKSWHCNAWFIAETIKLSHTEFPYTEPGEREAHSACSTDSDLHYLLVNIEEQGVS